MAFLFIPINQMVLGAFRGEELGQVAGMQNFFRQIGGSIGIASLDTLLTRFSAQHHNDLMSNVNALNITGYHDYLKECGVSGFAFSKRNRILDPRITRSKEPLRSRRSAGFYFKF